MYVESFRIENLRCFKDAGLELQYPGRKQENPPKLNNVNVLLGNNGSGKTTTLKAIALSVLSPVIESAGYVPYSLVRRSSRATARRARVTAELVLHNQDIGKRNSSVSRQTGVTTVVNRIKDVERLESILAQSDIWESMYDDSSPAFLLLGYGATRRVESSETIDIAARQKSRLLRYQRVAGLFEEHMTLVPLTAWMPLLRTQNPGRYKQVHDLINRLLPSGTRFTGELDQGDYLFRHRGVSVPFGAMSDGYRAYIGWVGDMLHHVCMGCPSNMKLVDNRGVVLIDEVDLHLHPEWQRTVIPLLSRFLPKLQFVMTTHSPIVAGTLQAANLFLMDSGPSGASTIVPCEEEIHGLNADQVLLSSAFGLRSSRAESFLGEMRKVSEAAQKGDRDAARLLTRLLARGEAAYSNDGEGEELGETPRWAVRAAHRRKVARKIAEAQSKSVAAKRHSAPHKKSVKRKA